MNLTYMLYVSGMSVLAFVAAAGVFWLLSGPFTSYVIVLARGGFQELRKRYVENVGEELNDSFDFLDPNTAFILNSLGFVVAAVVGYLLIGPVGAVGGAVLAYLAPRFIINRLKKRRIEAFLYQFPDALRVLASSLSAGVNITRAIEQLANNQPAPLSEEFSIVLAESRVGRDLNESLQALQSRVPLQELELFNSAVSISRSVGGDLAETLESLAGTLQEKATIEGKIKALTSMGRMQGWVVGFLPIGVGFMLYAQMPEEMSMLFTTLVGWITLTVIILAMVLAAWMIQKIVNIDI